MAKRKAIEADVQKTKVRKRKSKKLEEWQVYDIESDGYYCWVATCKTKKEADEYADDDMSVASVIVHVSIPSIEY